MKQIKFLAVLFFLILSNFPFSQVNKFELTINGYEPKVFEVEKAI